MTERKNTHTYSVEKICKVLGILSFFGYLCLTVFFSHLKTNYHIDEISSYISANNSLNMQVSLLPEFNHTYENAKTPYLDQMAVKEGHRFDFGNVAEIYGRDVHPPLYGFLLHGISSFFPGVYSKWFAAVINIAASILSLFFIRRIVRKLTEDEICVLITTVCFCFCSGILSSLTYYRMYHLAMFFVVWITYLFIELTERADAGAYIQAGIAVFLGVFTQYYVAIFVFFAAAAFVITMIIRKKYKTVGIFFADMLIAGVVYILVFPASLNTVLGGGDRSGEVFENLRSSFSVMGGKILRCTDIVNKQVFSGFLFWIIPVILLFAVINCVKIGKKGMKEVTLDKWVIPLCGCVGYLLLVSIVTVYETPRYFYPIYAVLLCVVIDMFFLTAKKLFKMYAAAILCIIVFGLCTAYMFKDNVHYLYRSSADLLNWAEQMNDTDCVFVLKKAYDANAAFLEVKNYDSVTFISSYELPQMASAKVDTSKGIVVKYAYDCDAEAIDRTVHNTWPELGDGIWIGEHSGTATVYYSRK